MPARHAAWVALLATLLTPWIGPHIDTYVPLGWVLLRSVDESPDVAFYLLAGAGTLIAYAAWFLLLRVIRRR